MKKMKRYNGEDDQVTSDTAEEMANSSTEAQDIANEAKGDAMLKSMRDEAAKPKAMAKATPKITPKASPAPVVKVETKSEAPSTTSKPKSAKAERDDMMAARRERTMGALKGFGSFLSDLPGKAMENYRASRPVSRQVQKERDQAASRGNLAKGGSASSRADGIAMKGKTRGTMVMCGGGTYK